LFREIKEAYNTECKEGTYRIANQNLGGDKKDGKPENREKCQKKD